MRRTLFLGLMLAALFYTSFFGSVWGLRDAPRSPIVSNRANAKDLDFMVKQSRYSYSETIAKLSESSPRAEQTPPTPSPASPPAAPSPSPAPAGCRSKVVAGNLEPTQGVWQDDYAFDDQKGKQIVLDSKESEIAGYPVFDAQLPMIAGRNTALFGVAHARSVEKMMFPAPPGDRDTIAMVVESNCATFVKVRFDFTLKQTGESDVLLYRSQEIRSIPLDPPRRQVMGRYEVDLPMYGGIPGARASFTLKPDKKYRIDAQLIRTEGDVPTGLFMAVHGVVKKTQVPEIDVRPVFFTLGDIPTIEKRAKGLADATRLMIGDYYPIVPGTVDVELKKLSAMNVPNWKTLDFLKHEVTTSAFLGDAGRVVMVLTDHDYNMTDELAPFIESTGRAISSKVAIVRESVTYKTVLHELTHTFPYIWSQDEMQQQCSAPGDYHNLDGLTKNGHLVAHRKWAYGERMYVGGVPDRVRINANWAYMTNTAADDVYAAQCDFWHLANALAPAGDPDVLLVQGHVVRGQRGVQAQLYPFYDLQGDADLQPGAPKQWNLTVREDGGAVTVYPIRSPFTNNEEERALSQGWFAYRIPTPAGPAQLLLTGPGVSLSRKIEPERPTVSITAPVDGSTVAPVKGRLHVTWSAKLPGGGTGLATVLYGTKETALVEQVFETSADSFDVLFDPATHTHRVRVVVTDGARSAAATVNVTTK